MANRLATESSPYLLQHRDNPVHWWPWGPEAFAEAKAANKPVFLSIGYAACHWCHVMAHESFEDDGTAAVMNELFVNIKIDREERPDVDAIYMNAIMVQGEGGGWPLSAFCLPDGRPYFLGTYFPKTPRRGRKSFVETLRIMQGAFRTQHDAALDNAEAVMEGLAKFDAHYRGTAAAKGVAGVAGLGAQLVIKAGQQLAERCDAVHGGLAGAPKFPSSATHLLLGQAARLPFGERAHGAYLDWAQAMARGGIYDHVGGGFARYAVDDKWLVPHFEKMLYDQGQLLAIYADVVALTAGDADRADLHARGAEVIADTTAFLARELGDPDGGLWSSLDADSEGQEGRYYVWTPAQLKAAVGPRRALELGRAYGVTEQGNFEDGATVLSRVTPAASSYEEESLREGLALLRAARGARVRPGTDDKVLAGWNGLAISGLVRGWGATGHAPALALATRVAEFLRDRMIVPAGPGVTLRRIYKRGANAAIAGLEGTLDDHAFCAVAFLDLAEATGDAAWWRLGRALVERILVRFVDGTGATLVFYLAAAGDPLLIHRPESHHDGAIPAGAGAAVEALLRLGTLGDDERYLGLAERYLGERLGDSPATAAWSTSRLLCCLDRYLHGQVLVVSRGAGHDGLVTVARRLGSPILSIAGPWAAPSLVADKRDGADGTARAYLCRGTSCSAPVATRAELAALLSATAPA